MIGIIVVGHIHFASALRSAVQAIAGEQKQIIYIDFLSEMSTEQLEQQLRQAIPQCQQGEGIIIFTDIAGGSPCNRASALLTEYSELRVITGSNLPMIVNACLEREGLSLDELTSLILETGRVSIGQVKLQVESNKEISADDLINDAL